MVIEDEGYNLPYKVGQWVENLIKALKIDPYNEQVLVRLTVTRINTPPPLTSGEDLDDPDMS